MVTIDLVISTIVILLTLSFMYKETPLYRLAEYLAISSASAILTVSALQNINTWGIVTLQRGEYVYLFGIVLGVLLFSRFFPKYSYLARYGIGAMVGVSFGVSVPATIKTSILDQIVSTAQSPIINTDLVTSFSSIVLILIVTTSIFYFVYTVWGKKSVKEKQGSGGILDNVVLIGRYGLMLAFGAMLGNMVMDRFSSLIYIMKLLLGLFGLARF